jgi:hypothetical protein
MILAILTNVIAQAMPDQPDEVNFVAMAPVNR